GIDIDRSGVLLDDNVVAQRKTKTGSFAGRLGRKEWVEYFAHHLGGNAAAVVPNLDLNTFAQVLGRGSKGRLVAIKAGFRLAFRCRIEAVRNQVEENPRHLLRKQIDPANRRIERPLQVDFKFLIFGPGAVIGKVEAFFDKAV